MGGRIDNTLARPEAECGGVRKEEGGNVHKLLPDHMASQPKRYYSSIYFYLKFMLLLAVYEGKWEVL
jgi:hypothetical protein